MKPSQTNQSMQLVGVTAFAFLVGAASVWLLFKLGRDWTFPRFGEELGSFADWIAAVAACVAAIATIMIGQAAHAFAREAEDARTAEAKSATQREEAEAKSQSANREERKRREDEAITAQILVMRSTAEKACYPQTALAHVFPPEGGSNPGFSRSRRPMILQLELTVLYVDAISWSDDFKKALDAESIETLSSLERSLLWYRALTTDQIDRLRSAEDQYNESGPARLELDWNADSGVLLVRESAKTLSEDALKFIECLDRRAQLFMQPTDKQNQA
ncbi:hypothetical protein [Stenotrophomonas muris]|uniref:hypothetical protein n=1 Tax=Stenotrophomonas muris TaxID=2963283 RepID=UPI0039C739A6